MFTAFERPNNLPDAIARQIRFKILSSEFQEGQKLPTELELAELFQVSRNVVREAIAQLKLNGLIETRRGVGTFVSKNVNARKFEVIADDLLDKGQLRQVYQLRIEIESGAAALAAQSRSAAQLKSLEKALRETDQAGGDWERGAEAALKFHMAVTQCSNNPYFIRLMEHLGYVLHNAVRTLRFSTTGTERIEHVEREHHAIFDAIRDRDAQRARGAMRDHLSNGMERYEYLNKKE